MIILEDAKGSIAFSPRDDLLATGAKSGEVRVWGGVP